MLALGSVQEVIERQIKAGKVEFDIPGKAFFRCVEFFYRIRHLYTILYQNIGNRQFQALKMLRILF